MGDWDWEKRKDIVLEDALEQILAKKLIAQINYMFFYL